MDENKYMEGSVRNIQSDKQNLQSYNFKANSKKFLSSIQKIRDLSNQSIRDVGENDRSNSTIVAGYNVTNLIQGIGILGVPYAIAKGSWIGIILIIFIAFVASSTGTMLIECLYQNKNLPNSKRIYKTYSCIGEAVWPKFGKSLVTVISLVEMFGGTTLYIILLSVESQRFLLNFFSDVNINYCCIILTYAVLPITFVKRMSIISWFSFIAVVGLISSIGIIMTFCFFNFSKLSINNFPAISWSSVPLSMGIITFSYCAHAAFPGIEASMKHPNSFDKMMKVSFTTAAVIKFLMGFLFNLISGNEILQQCSLNVDIYEFSLTLEIFVIINTFFSIPLVMFVISERIDEIFQYHFPSSMWPGGVLYWYWLLLSRGIIMTLSMLMAMIVPHFALVMGLVGSITGSCLTFIFPGIFSLSLKRSELTKLQKVYRILIIATGIFFGISGTIVSMIDIVQNFKM
uniref:Slc32a-1 n=1 Tax=Schmidtea mediterranea TaxID=79327 RepID=A0A0H3YJH0_SCHMD|nr:slc32a-1 [Schmidtea mediterranea]